MEEQLLLLAGEHSRIAGAAKSLDYFSQTIYYVSRQMHGSLKINEVVHPKTKRNDSCHPGRKIGEQCTREML
jgi:hypothetical protein